MFSKKRSSKQFDFSSLSIQPEKFHEVSGNYLLHLHYYWCYYSSCCYWRYFDDAVDSQKVLHHLGRTFHYFPIWSIICSAQNFGILLKIIFAVAVVSHKILTILHKFFLPLLCVITDSTSTWNYMITLIFWKKQWRQRKNIVSLLSH